MAMNFNWKEIRAEIGEISKMPAGRALIKVLCWAVVIFGGVIIYQNIEIQSCKDGKEKAVRELGDVRSKCEGEKLTMQREFGDSVKAFYVQRDREKTEEFRSIIAELKEQVATATARTDRAIIHSAKTERSLNRIDSKASKILQNGN